MLHDLLLHARRGHHLYGRVRHARRGHHLYGRVHHCDRDLQDMQHRHQGKSNFELPFLNVFLVEMLNSHMQ